MAGSQKKDATFWTEAAKSYAAEGNLVAALSSARNALRLGRHNPEAWYIGCETLVKQDRQGQALRFARALARYAPKEDTKLQEYARQRIAEAREYFATLHRRFGHTDLTYAAGRDEIAKVKELLDAGAIIDERDSCGGTALHAAAGRASPELIRLLVERGADIEATNSLLETPLVYACRLGNRAAVPELLRLDANVRHVAKEKHTALWYAIHSMKDVDTVRLLVEAGADPNETYQYRDNPFLLAISAQVPAVCEFLLPLTKDPGRMNKHQVSALHFCASYDDYAMIRRLLERGVDVNATTDWGQTALMSACEKNSVESVRVLLAHGARTDLKTKYGDTARSLAEHGSREEVLELLNAAERTQRPSGNGKQDVKRKK